MFQRTSHGRCVTGPVKVVDQFNQIKIPGLKHFPIIWLCLALAWSLAHGAPADNVPLDDGWKKLTLREKIGQTVIMDVPAFVKTNTTDEELATGGRGVP